MTPEQIADHLVEMGIINSNHHLTSNKYRVSGDYPDVFDTAEQAIQDWRVAGKVLESMRAADISVNIDGIHAQGYIEAFNLTDKKFPTVNIGESLPQAICTAYCEATSD